MEKSIREFLLEHAKVTPVSFHMPGHKGSAIYRDNGYGYFLDNIMDCDITEIPGADNLFQTEGIILATMDKYRRLYDVKKSYLQINGSSGGIISSILATVHPGKKLVMARNCHKSVFNALSLGNIEPVYAYPETIEKYGILGEISPGEIGRCLDENPEAEAVILPSPNYYGICSDIAAIAEEVHRRGKILIVDQAHGAHLKFFDKYTNHEFPKAAEDLGADLVINSIHKTLASFTQTAILNLCTDNVDANILEDKLQAIESSSPSYPLMGTLDINADLLIEKGEKLMTAWAQDLDYFYEEASKIPGLQVMSNDMLDRTKINIDMSDYGLNGNQMEELLMKKGIFIELVTGNIVMCMTGIGNCRRDYERFIDALKEIASSRKLESAGMMHQPTAITKTLPLGKIPKYKEFVHIDEAAGRVCALSIIPYPPGVPIACPGEILDKEVIEYIKARRAADEKVIGVTQDEMVLVGRE